MTNDNERIDDLQRNGYRIIQNKDCFCFGMDAVLLSSFAKAQKNEQVLDLGTGNGVIPILMQAKNPDAAGFTGLEIQAVSADLARRSVELNGIGEAGLYRSEIFISQKLQRIQKQNTRQKHRQSWHARSQERSAMNLKLKKFTVMIQLKT